MELVLLHSQDSLAEHSDGPVASVHLRLGDALHHVQEAGGGGGLAVLRPLSVVVLGHSEGLIGRLGGGGEGEDIS